MCEPEGKLQEYLKGHRMPDFTKCSGDKEALQTNLLSKHFSLHEPVGQVSARKCFDFK